MFLNVTGGKRYINYLVPALNKQKKQVTPTITIFLNIIIIYVNKLKIVLTSLNN